MIKTIKYSEYKKSLPAKDSMLSFDGLGADNLPGRMTPDKLAAVVGGLVNRHGVVIDCNADLADGVYVINKDSGTTNAPIDYGCLTVHKSENTAGGPVVQTIVSHNGREIYQRISWVGAMSEWEPIIGGGNMWVYVNPSTKLKKLDFSKKITPGFYVINNLSRDTLNPPVGGSSCATLISSAESETLQGIDGKLLFTRYTGENQIGQWVNQLI